MSKTIRVGIMMILLAGLLLTPACSHNSDEAHTGANVSSGTPSPAGASVIAPPQTSEEGIPTGDSPTTPEPQEEIQVISTEEELEEYFNSITEEEIEELFKIIEDIDISEDINPEADHGFDEIQIP